MIRTEALRVFVNVADCGNIRDAAERLFRTPSAISMTLKQLEEQLGARLFETDRKSTLTALGAEMHTIATELLRDHDRALDRIEAAATGRQGRLQLASVPSVAAELLPGLLADFLTERPGVTIELVDTDSSSVHALVAGGTVELGIAGPPDSGSGLTFTPLFRDPFRLVCRADHALADRTEPVTWDDLGGQRIISNEAASTIGAAEYRALVKSPALSARNVISLLALVRAGAGLTLLPRLATVSLGPDLRALPIADPTAQREVGVILRQSRTPTPVCGAFLDRIVRGTRDIR
ncbi:DNA-binding transcriptional regulator, LysR family [Roseovarius azorensis]|uniref:DNA-binding transcriptional regulator, LysR family n=1 Tax=Roseovarius azorensis TaxID=1287727 RepID=A0A1H7NW02_9RHOB|nr:LysR family transcriptional regulator [Roseovarius azorensis]SEL27479.1 DNA-binding transcriptional regulator, LysR family [Roseovarius azorensis]